MCVGEYSKCSRFLWPVGTRWFPDGRIGRVRRTGKMAEIETKRPEEPSEK